MSYVQYFLKKLVHHERSSLRAVFISLSDLAYAPELPEDIVQLVVRDLVGEISDIPGFSEKKINS